MDDYIESIIKDLLNSIKKERDLITDIIDNELVKMATEEAIKEAKKTVQ